MMNVNELIRQPVNEGVVAVEGFVVYLNDGRLYLIDLNYGDDYFRAPAILIENDGLPAALENNVGLYGGGTSRLFHRAKITGHVIINSACLSLYVDEILVEDNKKWLPIDIKKHYDARHGDDSIDWNDIFKQE